MYERKFGDPTPTQEILNALPARNRPERKRVPVRARIVWAEDGEEWRNCHAIRLDEDEPAIHVELLDKRSKFIGVWLRPDDVEWAGKSE